MIEIAWYKSSLLLKIQMYKTQTLHLFTVNIKTDSIYQSC